ncbi:MAG TPA: hypothetical protein VKY73_13380 [Polyangiaceae bacterium]|nr:hypothetical protein [Polyangiaceae bacterium]
MSEGAALEERKQPARALRRPRWRRRQVLVRWAAVSTSAALGGLLGLWVAVHRYEWMGPLVANGLRAVIGTDNVARLEDFVYAVEDRVNRVRRKHEPPQAYWTVPTALPRASTRPVSSAVVPEKPALSPFRPVDPGPFDKKWTARGDGVWVPIVDPRRAEDDPRLYKTLLHPDPTRGWAEVFVVAVDLRRVDIHLMAGSQEPKFEDEENPPPYERKAKIPEEHHDALLAAFNGGFMTEHGGYGMKVDDVVLVSPKPDVCSLVRYTDGSLQIASWKRIADREPEMLWYRQAPACMVQNGKLHPGLAAGSMRRWGATLDGETVIRRSAVGLSADRQILYVSITNHTTARVLADGLHHAGAVDIAQMDVNWSYPKFVLYEPHPDDGRLVAVALARGFEFSEDEYIRRRSRRDFFYITRKPD